MAKGGCFRGLIHRYKLSRAIEYKHNTSDSQGSQDVLQDTGYWKWLLYSGHLLMAFLETDSGDGLDGNSA